MYYVYFMTKYHSHGVQPLSNNQKVKLATHFFTAIKSWILMVNSNKNTNQQSQKGNLLGKRFWHKDIHNTN